MPTPVPPKLVGEFPNAPEPYRSEELWPAYFRAFGEFINQFGQTETTLSFYLEDYLQGLLGGGTGTGDRDSVIVDVVRALAASLRTGDLAVKFKLCMKAWNKAGNTYSPEQFAEADELFSQLGQIRFIRDRTAHYGVQIEGHFSELWFRTINRYTVNDIEKTEEILFKIEDLEAATADLKTICFRLPRVVGMQQAGEDYQPQLPPWLYKPSSLVKRAYRLPTSPPPPSHPPKAWWVR